MAASETNATQAALHIPGRSNAVSEQRASKNTLDALSNPVDCRNRTATLDRMDVDENLDNESSSPTQTVSGTAPSVVDAAAAEPTEARSVNDLLAERQPIAVDRAESCPVNDLLAKRQPIAVACAESCLVNDLLAECQPIAVARAESCPIDILTVQKTPFTAAGVEAGSANVSLAEHQPIPVARAAELCPVDMLTARSNVGPERVSSSVRSKATSGFSPTLEFLISQSDSDLTDLETNFDSDHDPSVSNTKNAKLVPPKRKRINDCDSIHGSSESDTDLDQDPSQMETEHSKPVGSKIKHKRGPPRKRQKRKLTTGLTPHSDSDSRNSSGASHSTLSSQQSLQRKYNSENDSYIYSGTLVGSRIHLDIVTVSIFRKINALIEFRVGTAPSKYVET